MKPFVACLSITALCLHLIFGAAATAQDAARPNILVADFEGDTYGEWKVQAEAFGTSPAKGALDGQMHVSGFRGKGLVNSFRNGDRTTGTLASPPIKIERKYLTFLVGSGGHAGKMCMNLLGDGDTVHTIAGNNSQPGGSEALES